MVRSDRRSIVAQHGSDRPKNGETCRAIADSQTKSRERANVPVRLSKVAYYAARVDPLKEQMNLQHLKWTKNVKPADGGYAYSQFKVSELFKLAWRDDEDNANRLSRDDLILLRQHGCVTHLVKVLDRSAEHEDWVGDFNIYRIVEVLWTIDCTHPPTSAKAEVIFGYSAVLDYRGGNAMKLEELDTFKKSWDSKGGLPAFQEHVKSGLAAV